MRLFTEVLPCSSSSYPMRLARRGARRRIAGGVEHQHARSLSRARAADPVSRDPKKPDAACEVEGDMVRQDSGRAGAGLTARRPTGRHHPGMVGGIISERRARSFRNLRAGPQITV
jgi:hypothetical protein